jgi:hypothetical protein
MKKLDFDFISSLKLDNGNFDVLIQVKGFTPTRPAPPCNNPDSPLFSDCGDDPEFDEYIVHFYFMKNQVFFMEVPEDLLDIMEEEIYEMIFTKGDEIYWEEDDYDNEEEECNNKEEKGE